MKNLQILTTMLFILMLSGCGIKPSQLQAPSEDSTFPRTYPAPELNK